MTFDSASTATLRVDSEHRFKGIGDEPPRIFLVFQMAVTTRALPSGPRFRLRRNHAQGVFPPFGFNR